MFVDRGGVVRQVDTHFESWQLELDRLELDVMRAERAFATDGLLRTDGWQVPGLAGPMPEDLHERARELLVRQESLLAGLAERLGATGRQQAVADHVDRASTRDRSRPVYFDISA